MMQTFAVLSGNYKQFSDFLGQFGRFGRDCRFVHVTNRRDARGKRFDNIFCIGTFWELKQHEELFEVCQSNLYLESTK